jgi:hypothetical protein
MERQHDEAPLPNRQRRSKPCFSCRGALPLNLITPVAQPIPPSNFNQISTLDPSENKFPVISTQSPDKLPHQSSDPPELRLKPLNLDRTDRSFKSNSKFAKLARAVSSFHTIKSRKIQAKTSHDDPLRP